ncbi:MAG: galactokinase family protein [Lachnospiraceae bacterium]|nr:galactokinase family protein [Lachnospiraceae bacterium]
MNLRDWRAAFAKEAFQKKMHWLYGNGADKNTVRYEKLLDMFEETFGAGEGVALFSAPGRTEIGGNHTDHQHGCVLAASVDMDMIAAAELTAEKEISIQSEGYPLCRISLEDLSIREEEKNTTASLIRGVAARFEQLGCRIGGFRACVMSSVLPGSGISSSAAFEVLVGNMINSLFFQEKASPVEIAQIGQYAENVYFGKPSGLMDQTASSVGNMLTIDFKDTANPVVKKLDIDFEKSGLALCIIDSGADHANLTDEYAAIPIELKKICRLMGKEVLREIPKEEFMAALPKIRKEVGDRAILRALHFYGDNERVPKQATALESGDMDTFLKLVKESGYSSWMYLQNIVPCGYSEHQEMAIALSLCDNYLNGRGAFRVHGGGFAGTVQAFVPVDMLDEFKAGIEEVLGEGSCHILSIRPAGGMQVTLE